MVLVFQTLSQPGVFGWDLSRRTRLRMCAGLHEPRPLQVLLLSVQSLQLLLVVYRQGAYLRGMADCGCRIAGDAGLSGWQDRAND